MLAASLRDSLRLISHLMRQVPLSLGEIAARGTSVERASETAVL